ncbi:MAG TPA: serine/threonine-protein kinase [Planctomycetota bacterium]|nr:serine/threonine-protein kinase [Planctomycetota bacterium]
MAADALVCTVCSTSFPLRGRDQLMTPRCMRCGASLRAARSPVELPPASPPEESRETLGNYRLIRRLGRGTMGVVYEASDTRTGRRVALKLLFDAGPDPKAFLREARAFAALPPHPSVVAVRNGGVFDGTCCLEMDFVDGVPYHDWRRDHPAIRAQVAVLRDVACALEHVHAHGIVHRDLKPENVLVDRENRPHLTDFGLARLGDGTTSSSSGSGFVVGTPAYVSPEQALRPREADRRSDIYSLGIMLYETFTGLLPFTGRSTVGLLMSVMNDEPPPVTATPQARRSGADAAMDAIVRRAIARRPEDRYPTAAALAEALDAWIGRR